MNLYDSILNGTNTIPSILNGVGDILTRNTSTGVLQLRTLAQLIGDIGAEPSFSKGSIIQGAGISLSGTLTSRLVGSGDVTINHLDTSSQASVANSNGSIIQSITLDTYGHITALSSLDGDSRWVRTIEVLNNSSTWSHVTLQGGIDLTGYTTGSSGFPSTLGFAVAFYAPTSDSTSGFGRAFAINREYNTENYYLGSPNTSGVHNGWRLIYHSGNLTPATIGAATASHTHSAADITSGILAVARGGTGIGSYTAGNYIRALNSTTLEQRTPAQVVSDLGISPSSFQRDKFIFSGTYSFTLTRTSPNAVMVFLNGQKLQFTDDWSISSNVVTVTTDLWTGAEISIEYFYSTPDVVPSGLNGTGTSNYITKWNTTTQLGVSLIQDNGSVVTLPAATDIPAVAATVDTDKFVVLDGTRFKFRTGTELLSDIGAASSSHNQAASTITAGTFASGDFVFPGNLDINGQLSSPANSKGNSGTGTVTFNWNDGNVQTVTLNGNCTFALSNGKSGASYQIIVAQDGTVRTVSWSTTVKWPGGTAPTFTGTAGKFDIITISFDGTNYFGVISKNH